VNSMSRMSCGSFGSSVGAVLLASGAMLCGAGCDSHPAAQAASISAPVAAAPVSSGMAQPSVPPFPPEILDAKHFTTTGPLVAEQQADIAAERDGHVTQIAVQIGDHVRKGQVLAVLDDRMLRSICDAQRARVASLHAQVAEWEAEQKSVEADLRRADIMRSEKIRSEEDWEHVKYKLDETVAEVARYRAEEAAASADLESASLQLEQSRIVAPFAGVVGRSSVRPPQEVKKGDVLFWITAVAPLHVLFTVPESAMAHFSVGTPLELTTADYPELRQAARILHVSPVVDPASGSVQVIGVVGHASPLLKPGMTMQVRLAR
jgi:membrane fusion protein, multidrug efflux system